MSGNQIPLPILSVDLGGMSAWAPAITGDDLFGFLSVWADVSDNNLLKLTTFNPGGQDWTPPIVVGESYQSFYALGIATAYDWYDIAITWCDNNNQINLLLSSNFSTPMDLGSSKGIAPSITYGEGMLYIAWISPSGNIHITTCNQNGIQSNSETNTPAESVNLCWYNGTLFLTTGGSLNSGASAMSIYTLDSDGTLQLFNNGPQYICYNAPSLSIQDGVYCLAYCDNTLQLNIILTQDLTDCSPKVYPIYCHGGNIAATIAMGNINLVWSYLGEPTNLIHHTFEGTIPIDIAGYTFKVSSNLRSKLEDFKIKNPCNASQVYDPANDECVDKLSCNGNCVLGAFGAMGYWNPFSYAFCMLKNC